MRHTILFTFLFFCGGLVFSQTTNEGVLSVMGGTKFSTVEALDNREEGSFVNDGEAYLYSHLNNDGVVDFVEEGGVTYFIGSSDQIISGSNPSYLHDVVFRNRSHHTPFLLTGTVDINGTADFNQGIVDNRNFGGTIIFRHDADHINTSDESHVNGPVEKLGSTGFIFPKGHESFYRVGGISAPASARSVFKGTYYLENSDAQYPHALKAGILKEINDREYWTITEETSYEEDVLITLSWRQETTPSFLIDAGHADELSIVRWDEASNMWVDEGGVSDVSNQTVTTAISGYGVFTLGTTKEKSPGGLVIYNGVTPNDDGVNDFFFIDIPNDGSVRDLHVMIFNRWGVKVYESDNYGVNGDVFRGYSSGRVTVDKSKQLPSGTYFYILDYEYGAPTSKTRHKQAGYLYLSGN